MGSNIEKGKKGELIAKEHLILKGYNILDLNYRNKVGEIDIIALDKNTLVFIEVKSRTSTNFGYAYEAVNRRKQEKIIYCSYLYLNQKRLMSCQVRYDIIEVYLTPNIKINHIENAFC
ncbi:YraN family protein [Tissierella carlieri]|uniref:YraN family protein n=1 Tax=Tissierella carlieri TaxID=689904 RepID=UPI001C126C68|nr:YraN family protein [Tissierella carlieri]MBU5314214.1 YraN family protein [Tissierella carlieri]